MNLHPIQTGHFKLDGGAMFGVVPKVIWNKTNPADENNQIEMVVRCLLIIEGDRKILIDAGFGEKQDEKFMQRYAVNNIPFEQSLAEVGLTTSDITDVILTHLHFDHCGGGTKWNTDKTKVELTFPNATYHISKQQLSNALNPNNREKASLLHENIDIYHNNKQVNLINDETKLFPFLTLKIFNGHTHHQIIPFINYNNQTIVYTADFLALSSHIPIPFVMAYDIDPLLSMKEKENFFKEAIQNNYILFFEHDPYIETCTLKQGTKGIEINKKGKLIEIL